MKRLALALTLSLLAAPALGEEKKKEDGQNV